MSVTSAPRYHRRNGHSAHVTIQDHSQLTTHYYALYHQLSYSSVSAEATPSHLHLDLHFRYHNGRSKTQQYPLSAHAGHKWHVINVRTDEDMLAVLANAGFSAAHPRTQTT